MGNFGFLDIIFDLFSFCLHLTNMYCSMFTQEIKLAMWNKTGSITRCFTSVQAKYRFSYYCLIGYRLSINKHLLLRTTVLSNFSGLLQKFVVTRQPEKDRCVHAFSFKSVAIHFRGFFSFIKKENYHLIL